MKTNLTMLKLLIVLCSALTTTAVFAQPFILTLTNTRAAIYQGVPLNGNTNFSGNNGFAAPGDTVLTGGSIATFDGTVPGTIYMFQLGNLAFGPGGPVGGFAASVISIDLTPSQISPVHFFADTNQAAPPNFGLDAFRVQGPGGQLILGDNSIRQLAPVLRPSSSLHTWINNSTNPVIIHPNVQFLNGGGAPGHVINFQGTGDFHITNALRFNNSAPAGNLQWDSTGTTIWSSDGGNGSPGNANRWNSALGNVIINAGTVIMKMPRLLPNSPGANTVAHSGTLLRFDGPAADSDTIVRTFSGTGLLEFSNGTWTLTSPFSTFSGSILLNGGKLIAGGAESVGVGGPFGIGGVISFAGGVLGYSAFNTFDYSSRFATPAGQQYKIDTAGQSVTFTNNLASSGGSLVKLGNGTLTLAGTSFYSGLTTVSNGTLALQGPKTGTGNITVVDNATLGIFEADGQQVTPGTLTLGTSTGANLEYDNVTNTTVAPLAPTNLSTVGTVTISINSGTFAVGQSFPLLAWTSGSAPAVTLGTLSGALGNLSTNGNSIQLNVTATAYKWTGLYNSCWDTTTTSNWTQNGIPTVFVPNNGPVLFDDTAPGTTTVTVCALVQPSSVTVNNSSLTYSIASSGGNNIAGGTGLSKSGSGTLTLSGGVNSYTGITTLKAGTLSVGALANGGVASDIGAASSAGTNLVFNGGTLQYTGGAANVNRLFTVGLSGGVIGSSGSGALTLNNPGTIGLGGTLALTGNNADTNILAASLVNSGALNKTGTGKWVLTGTNTYGGGTLINAGILQVGASPSGEIGSGNIVNNAVLVFKRTGTLTVPGAISGTGTVTKEDIGTVILANNNSYTGPTTINAGTLQVGNGGSAGSINGGGAITNNALLIFNTSGSHNYTGGSSINGPGNVVVRGGGTIKAIGASTYTGWTLIEGGSTFQPCEGNQGQLLSSLVTNNFGTLKLVRQDTGVFFYSNNIVGPGWVLKDVNNNNDSDVTLLGTNTYFRGTIIAGGAIVLGDGISPGRGSIVGSVFFTNSPTGLDIDRRIVFNRPDDVTFSGTISGSGGVAAANAGRVEQRGTGKLTLTGNNTHLGGATIVAGTMQVGNGGTSGSLGTGPIANTGTLIFNRAGTLNVGAVNGTGALQQVGPGTVTIGGSNSYTGLTVVSNGMLVVGSNSAIGDVELDGGFLAPGGYGAAIGKLTVNNLTINSGSVVVSLNRSSSPSNSVVAVLGTISYAGGGLRLLNFGPALVPGDKFTIFSQPITGGGSIPIVSPGFTVQNDLAVDGSVTVTAVSGAATALTGARSGGQFIVSWPVALTGLYLQAQTNSLTVGLSTNWITVPGSDLVNAYTNLLGSTNATVFFRLVPKP